MHGAVYGAIGIVAILLILAFGASPIFIIPVVVLAFGAFVMGSGLTALKDTEVAAGEPDGVPSTQEAAYDPAGETTQRTV
jgi:hypothetical protein